MMWQFTQALGSSDIYDAALEILKVAMPIPIRIPITIKTGKRQLAGGASILKRLRMAPTVTSDKDY
jgi:hypothetical protein